MEAHNDTWQQALMRRMLADRRLVIAIAVVVLLGMVALASAARGDTSSPMAGAVLAPAVTATSLPLKATPAVLATPPSHTSHHAPVSAVRSGSAPTVATHGTTRAAATSAARPAATATPNSEAQTPLVLTDPSATPVTSDQPWWQGALDVTWKLALVIALIYLAMRALAFFKQSGFGKTGAKIGGKQGRFFEQIEEIRLSPQHTLHAVRAGNKVLLLARTGGHLRPIGEVNPDEEADPMLALPAESFTRQMMRAWAGILPPSPAPGEAPAVSDETSVGAARDSDDGDLVADASDDDVIDAKWVTVQPDTTPAASPVADAAVPAPKRGVARASDKSGQFDETTERDILWYAEEHGVSAAAGRYGLTRQRVTAMRVRYERDRAAKELAQHRRERERAEQYLTRQPAHAGPETPDHHHAAEPESFTPLTATTRASLASTAYSRAGGRGGPKPPPPPPKPPPPPGAGPPPARNAPAASIAQQLAARFGIRVQNPAK